MSDAWSVNDPSDGPEVHLADYEESDLELTLACDPATRWSALRGCLTDAAACGVWDVRLAVGDKTVPIPLPRDKGVDTGADDRPGPPDVRVAVSVVAPKEVADGPPGAGRTFGGATPSIGLDSTSSSPHAWRNEHPWEGP